VEKRGQQKELWTTPLIRLHHEQFMRNTQFQCVAPLLLTSGLSCNMLFPFNFCLSSETELKIRSGTRITSLRLHSHMGDHSHMFASAVTYSDTCYFFRSYIYIYIGVPTRRNRNLLYNIGIKTVSSKEI
jgi:hypothetical protein